MTCSFEFMPLISVMLLRTLHLAFPCSSLRAILLRHIRSCSPSHLWGSLGGSLGLWCGFRGILRDPLSFQDFKTLSVPLMVRMSFCSTCIPLGVSLFLRQSSLRYTHYSHLLFTLMFTFLTLVNSIEEGHICRPPQRVFIFFIII